MDINKILKEKLGEAYTAELDKEIKTLIKENQANYVDKVEYENKLKEIADLNEKLKAQEQDKETNMSLQEKYNRLKIKSEKAEQDYANNLKELKLNSALEKSGSKNVKALKALLDSSKISYEQDGTIKGLDEQIESLKKSDAYLFASEEKPLGVGGFPNTQEAVQVDTHDFTRYMNFTPITGFNSPNLNNIKGDK